MSAAVVRRLRPRQVPDIRHNTGHPTYVLCLDGTCRPTFWLGLVSIGLLENVGRLRQRTSSRDRKSDILDLLGTSRISSEGRKSNVLALYRKYRTSGGCRSSDRDRVQMMSVNKIIEEYFHDTPCPPLNSARSLYSITNIRGLS